MADKLRKGDKVTWTSHGTDVDGTIEDVITERTEAAGRTVAATPDEPQYLVRSSETGNTAVHKPEALRRHR